MDIEDIKNFKQGYVNIYRPVVYNLWLKIVFCGLIPFSIIGSYMYIHLMCLVEPASCIIFHPKYTRFKLYKLNCYTIRQSSTDSVTYIRTRVYRNTRFASPCHILWCGRLVYRLDKLAYTFHKIDLKNRESLLFQCFQAIFYFFTPLLFLAHLSWILKWAFLIAFCRASVCLSVNFSYFQLLLKNYWANFNQTWHNASTGEGDSSLLKWRAPRPFLRGDNLEIAKIHWQN